MKRYFVDFAMGFTRVDTDATQATYVSRPGIGRVSGQGLNFEHVKNDLWMSLQNWK